MPAISRASSRWARSRCCQDHIIKQRKGIIMKRFIATLFLLSRLTTGFATSSGTLIAFDDLPAPALGGTVVPNGYAGFNWSNLSYLDSFRNVFGPVLLGSPGS